MAKRYYWLKIKRDFFGQREIKKLRRLENGDTCVIIYMKMLTLALDQNNHIVFKRLEDTFEEDIALELDEDVEDVKRTFAFLEKHNLIECISEEEYFLPQGVDLTGSESSSLQRVKKHRDSKKKECYKTELCNENVTIDIDIEKEKEKDKEKEIEIDLEKDKDIDTDLEKKSHSVPKENVSVGKCVDDNLSKIVNLYEQNIGPIYPANRDWFVEISTLVEPELFNKAIEICIDKSNVTPSYLKGILKKWTNNKIFTLRELHAKEMESKNNVTYMKSSRSKKSKVQECKSEEIDPSLLEEMRLLESSLGV